MTVGNDQPQLACATCDLFRFAEALPGNVDEFGLIVSSFH
jgi:hypothetical protein